MVGLASPRKIVSHIITGHPQNPQNPETPPQKF